MLSLIWASKNGSQVRLAVRISLPLLRGYLSAHAFKGSENSLAYGVPSPVKFDKSLFIFVF